MANLLYFDCFSGISGDMILGAFLDAGLPLDELKRALGSLAVDGLDISATKVLRAGVSATKFRVHEPGTSHSALSTAPDAPRTSPDAPRTSHNHSHSSHSHHHEHRSLADILRLIDRSALSAAGRDRAKALFQRLGEAEAAIHQMPVERVHLHEVGALDSIVDIVGAVFALEWAGVDRIVCSPLNVGGGTVDSAHGHFPVPAPATLRLLSEKGAPFYSGRIQQELVTPTGALIATEYATSFEPLPPMTAERVGYGAGDRDFADVPNVLRIMIGRGADSRPGDRVVVIECEIDDMNPQLYGAAMERLYAAGALEVFYVPVQMKKNRPGTLLTVIAAPDRRTALMEIVFSETTTIGLRYHEVARECLRREMVPVETPLGTVRVKLAWRDGRVVNAVPEFDDCVALATKHQVPVKEVQGMAIRAFDVGGVRL